MNDRSTVNQTARMVQEVCKVPTRISINDEKNELSFVLLRNGATKVFIS